MASAAIEVTRSLTPLSSGLQRLQATVVKGFQRGSKSLGFPTANMRIRWDAATEDRESLPPAEKKMLEFMDTHEPGIYYGWCQVRGFASNRSSSSAATGSIPETEVPATGDASAADGEAKVPVTRDVLKAAVSIGWNPTYKDVKQKVIEPWILHDFGEVEFYGAELRLVLCGYVRGEIDFQGNFPLLIKAIKEDGEFCETALENHFDVKNDAFFVEP
ncbi:unnamed protein product [Amoebophrya sp. A25]|nr:unnamed protein product [Amoebophrya sp. A25]|eukprot:GSA25T00005181001.1